MQKISVEKFQDENGRSRVKIFSARRVAKCTGLMHTDDFVFIDSKDYVIAVLRTFDEDESFGCILTDTVSENVDLFRYGDREEVTGLDLRGLTFMSFNTVIGPARRFGNYPVEYMKRYFPAISRTRVFTEVTDTSRLRFSL